MKPAPMLLMTGTVCDCVGARPVKNIRDRPHSLYFYIFHSKVWRVNRETGVPIRSEDSPKLMTLGTEAMMRLCEEAGDAERLCRDVSVLTGGSGPLPDTCS